MNPEHARLLRRFAALPEMPMRVAIWRELLGKRTPQQVIDWLQSVFASLDAGAPGGRLAYAALIRVEIDTPAGAAVLAEAHAQGLSRIVGLFSPMPAPLTVNRAELRGPPLDPDRDVPLGERVSWARRPDRRTIERLLFDPNPRVVGRLLNNPKLTEADVLRIASRRPTLPAVLEEVFAHARWGQRPGIMEALILNPHTPLRIACGLVGLLDAQHARRIAKQPAAHPLVRAAARAR
jgi:hypothetical protein